MIKEIKRFLKNLSKGFTAAIILVCIFAFQFSSIPAFSQDAASKNVFGSVGFGECQIKADTSSSANSETLQKCVVQIVQFFFVASLFVIAVRIALESLISINPLEKGKAVDGSIKLVQDIIIGLMLLGSPAIFLSVFNTTTLDLSLIFNINSKPGNVVSGGSSGAGAGTATGASGGTTTGDGAVGAGDTAATSIPITVGGKTYNLSASDIKKVLAGQVVPGLPTDPASVTNIKNTIKSGINQAASGDYSLIGKLSPTASIQDINRIVLDVFSGGEAKKKALTTTLNALSGAANGDITFTKLANTANLFTGFVKDGCAIETNKYCNFKVAVVGTPSDCKGIFDPASKEIKFPKNDSFKTNPKCYLKES